VRAIKTTTISILALGLLAGSAAGVAAQDEESAGGVTTVTGTLNWVDQIDEGTDSVDPAGFGATSGSVATMRFFFPSEPRLTGDATVNANNVVMEFGETFAMMSAQTTVLSNDGGSWLGESKGFGGPGFDSGRTIVFVGQDGYEGLTAYLQGKLDWDTGVEEFQGFIVPTAMPEVPEPYAGE
jgi:hypothetical protein